MGDVQGWWRSVMLRMWAAWLALVFACASLPAHAVLTITICGGVNSPAGSGICAAPVDPLADSFGGTTGVAVGQSVDAVKVDNGAGASAVVPVSPNEGVPTPSGWADPSTLGGAPVPPASLATTVQWRDGSAAYCGVAPLSALPYSADAASAGSACANYLTSLRLPGSCNGVLSFAYTAGPNPSYYAATNSAGGGSCANGGIAGAIASVSSCPTGYTISGATCNLSDASVVVKPVDQVVGMVRSGNTITADVNDPDFGSNPSTSSSVLFVGGSGTSSISAGAVGLGGAVSVVVGAGGDSTITATKDLGNGTSRQTVIVVGAPAGDGSTKVTGVTSGTIQGSGSLAGSGAPVVRATKDPCGLPSTAPCKIDESGVSDSGGAVGRANALTALYADRTTAANAAAASGDASAFGAPKYAAPADTAGYIDNPLAGLGSDDCVNPTATLGGLLGQGATITIPICSVTGPIKVILKWFFYVLTLAYVWTRWTGREGKGV